MKLKFFTDPHLGKRLRSHTTTASQQRLTDYLYTQAVKAASSDPSVPVVCLGDLFDQYSNPEHIIEQGYHVASKCVAVLQGNHDVKNLKGEPSSLTLLKQVGMNSIVENPDPAKSHVEWLDQYNLCMIPHHFTQEAFEEALGIACADARAFRYILCLHVNVMERLSEDHSLYLTAELEELARTSFGLVLVGHEHVPSHKPAEEGLCGLYILGNTLPISFGEIAPRFTYIVDTETFEVTLQPLWNLDNYLELSAEDLLHNSEDNAVDNSTQLNAQFVRVQGELPFDQRAEFNKGLVRTWKENPEVFAINTSGIEFIRPGVELVESEPRIIGNVSLLHSLQRNATKAGFEGLFKEIEHVLTES